MGGACTKSSEGKVASLQPKKQCEKNITARSKSMVMGGGGVGVGESGIWKIEERDSEMVGTGDCRYSICRAKERLVPGEDIPGIDVMKPSRARRASAPTLLTHTTGGSKERGAKLFLLKPLNPMDQKLEPVSPPAKREPPPLGDVLTRKQHQTILLFDGSTCDVDVLGEFQNQNELVARSKSVASEQVARTKSVPSPKGLKQLTAALTVSQDDCKHVLDQIKGLVLNGKDVDIDNLASLLPMLTHIRVLGLCSVAMDESGAAVLDPCLVSMTNLQRLELDSNYLGEQGAAVFANSLKFLTELKQLQLSNNNIGDRGLTVLAPSLAKLSDLQVLCLDKNNLNAPGATALAPALEKLMDLRKFEIGDNFILSAGAKAIAPCFKTMDKLNMLLMSGNCIGDEGAKALADGIRGCEELKSLRLIVNNIGPIGLGALSLVFGKMKQLEVLRFNGNTLEDQGMRMLGLGLTTRSLRKLFLNKTSIGDEGIKFLSPHFQQMTLLSELELAINSIQDPGAKSLALVLPKMASLQKLHLNQNGIKHDGVVALAWALAPMTSLQKLMLDMKPTSTQLDFEVVVPDAHRKRGWKEVLAFLRDHGGDRGLPSLARRRSSTTTVSTRPSARRRSSTTT